MTKEESLQLLAMFQGPNAKFRLLDPSTFSALQAEIEARTKGAHKAEPEEEEEEEEAEHEEPKKKGFFKKKN